MGNNILICNGGAPTAVMNLTNIGLIEAAFEYAPGAKIYAAIGGTGSLVGGEASFDGRRHVARLDEYLADAQRRQLIKNTPSSWIGSGRYNLGKKAPKEVQTGEQDDEGNYLAAVDWDIARILEVIDRLEIGHVFFVGGDDTLWTLNNLARYQRRHESERAEWPTFLAVPKTIDNDLAHFVAAPQPGPDDEGFVVSGGRLMVVDACPGFPSAANYVANEVAHLAVEAWAFRRHYVIEIMGRNAGFLAAAAILARPFGYGPHLIGLPEHGVFDVESFKLLVAQRQREYGFGVYVVSEGILGPDGKPLASKGKDLFGTDKVGGAGELLQAHAAKHCAEQGLKSADVRYIRFGETQRVCSDFRTRADCEIAYNVGRRAAYWGLVRHQTGKIVTIVRQPGDLASWVYGLAPTELVAGKANKRVMDADWVCMEDAGELRVPMVHESYLDYLVPLVEPIVPIAPAYDGEEVVF